MRRHFSIAALALLGLVLAGCAYKTIDVPAVPATATSPAIPATTKTVQVDLLSAIFDKVNKLGDKLLADLAVADADAVAHGDAVSHQCYSGLIPIVQGIQKDLAGAGGGSGVPDGAALVYAFQRTRDLKGDISGGNAKLVSLRKAINLACGALQIDIQAGIADPMGLISGQ